MEASINNNLKDTFLAVETKRQLAEVLDVKYKDLIYNLHRLSDDERYLEFKIKKRGKGERLIIAPNSGIKYLQKSLANILIEIYPEKNCVHGYVKGKGIRTNALIHVRKKTIINIDLQEFFPSINFGRVRGIFKSFPFNFNDEVSTTLAQICCYKGILPQGAPTSPIISNFICRKLDNMLLRIANQGKFNYSRYADDITFSTNIIPIPKEIGVIKDQKLILSEELTGIINKNDFRINDEKTRFSHRTNHQEVTGLTVNEFPNVKRNYIRHVRAMLHAWEKFGITDATKEHFEKYSHKHPNDIHAEISFVYELVGKIGYIGMIKGKDDPIYRKMYFRIKRLYPGVKLSIIQSASELSNNPIIYGEGKTDWKHLKAALEYFKSKGEFVDLEVSFMNYEDTMKINNTELLKICESLSKTKLHKTKIICLFDRDAKEINKKVCENGSNFKNWGNNIFSVLLPVPKHRSFDEICIEHYYSDADLKILDKKGRRLFLSDEFDKNTGKHLTEELLYTNKNYLKSGYPRIIENGVVNPNNGDSKALSKNLFAEYIINKDPLFAYVDFENFREIFELLQIVASQ